MTTLDDFIRQTIKAYLARTNMSAREFGLHVFGGDPGFVSSLKKGRSLNLDTADRVLQFMDEAPIGPKFRDEVEAFLSRTGMKAYKLGEDALGDNTFVRRLRSGVSPGFAPSTGHGAGCTAPSALQARERSMKDPLAGDVPPPRTIRRCSSPHARPRPCSRSRPERSTAFERTVPDPRTSSWGNASFTRAKTSSNGRGRSA